MVWLDVIRRRAKGGNLNKLCVPQRLRKRRQELAMLKWNCFCFLAKENGATFVLSHMWQTRHGLLRLFHPQDSAIGGGREVRDPDGVPWPGDLASKGRKPLSNSGDSLRREGSRATGLGAGRMVSPQYAQTAARASETSSRKDEAEGRA